MNDAIQQLGLENDLELRYIDNKKGKGLFAKRDFQKRELVLVEIPFCVVRIPSEVRFLLFKDLHFANPGFFRRHTRIKMVFCYNSLTAIQKILHVIIV
jgi:hypothetical protein